MNWKNTKKLFQVLAEAIPDPTTELRYASHFELLISVILSAQATDISVNKATRLLFNIANTPIGIRKLGIRKLKTYIRTIGLYNTKARNIMHTCHILEEEYDSKVPETREELESLPGVGRKTANVILNTAFGKPTIAVDTHIFRVSNRTGLAPGKTVLKVEQGLLKITPRMYIQDAHHLLILHGRRTCAARKPRCLDCVISQLCEYENKTTE